MTALQLSGPEANTARQPGQEGEEMETEREEEEEEESEGGGRQERGRMDKKIDLQGQRHREVPLGLDRSGSLEQLTSEQTANERQTAHDLFSSSKGRAPLAQAFVLPPSLPDQKGGGL